MIAERRSDRWVAPVEVACFCVPTIAEVRPDGGRGRLPGAMSGFREDAKDLDVVP